MYSTSANRYPPTFKCTKPLDSANLDKVFSRTVMYEKNQKKKKRSYCWILAYTFHQQYSLNYN